MSQRSDTTARDAAKDIEQERRFGSLGRTPWLITGLLFGFMVINFSERTVLSLSAEPLMRDLNISASTFGLISSAFYFLYSISAIAVGFIADRFSLKWILAILAILWMLTQVPIFFFASTGVLLASRIALGAAEGPASPLASSAVYSWFPPENRGLPASIHTSGGSIAKICIAPLIALIIIIALGWRYAFLIIGLLSFAWAVAWFTIGREGPYAEPKPGRGSERTVRTVEEKARDRTDYFQTVLSKPFLLLLLASFPMFGFISVVLSWMPSYLQSGLQFTQVQSGFLYGTPGIGSLVFMIAGGLLTDRLMSRGSTYRVARVVFPCTSLILAGVMVAALPLLADVNRLISVGLLIVGYGLGTLAMPIFCVAVGSMSKPKLRSSVLSTFIALQALSGVAAPWLTGVLINRGVTRIDGYNLGFMVLGILIAGCAAITLVFLGLRRGKLIPGDTSILPT